MLGIVFKSLVIGFLVYAVTHHISHLVTTVLNVDFPLVCQRQKSQFKKNKKLFLFNDNRLNKFDGSSLFDRELVVSQPRSPDLSKSLSLSIG